MLRLSSLDLPLSAAALTPFLLSVALLVWLSQPAPPAAATAPQAIELDRRLGEGPLDLLLLGSSIPKRNLDADALGEGLGLAVTDATLHATNAPTWYVMLADRVYANGFSPSVVLVVSPVRSLLELAPDGHRARAVLAALSNGESPVVRAKTSGAAGSALSPALARLSLRATDARTALLDSFRNGTVGLLFRGDPVPGESVLERGQREADAATAEVLGDGGERASGLAGWSKDEQGDKIPIAAPEDSFVADMVDLVQGAGARIIFLQLPVRDPEQLQTPEALALAEGLARYLDTRRVPFVDLSDQPTSRDEFEDLVHMTPAGAERMTDVVIEALLSRGLLEDKPFSPNTVAGAVAKSAREGELPEIAPFSWSREGPCDARAELPAVGGLDEARLASLGLPGLPLEVYLDGAALPRAQRGEEIGESCSGTWRIDGNTLSVSMPADRASGVLTASLAGAFPLVADVAPALARGAVTPHRFRGTVVDQVLVHWLYPGTSARITLPDRAPVYTSALVVGGDPGSVSLELDGARVDLARERSVLRAGPLAGEALVWEAGDAWLVIRELRTADRWYIGDETSFAMPLDLLPVAGANVEVTYASPPPEIEQSPWKPSSGVGLVEVSGGPWLDLATVRAVADREACVPVILQAGAARMHVRARPQSATFERPRRAEVDLTQARLVFSPERRCSWWPTDAAKATLGMTAAEAKRAWVRPKGPPRQYFEMLGTQRWLYPGDSVTLVRSDTDRIHGLARELKIEAYRFGELGTLHLELEVGGEPRGTWTIGADAGEAIDMRLPLEAPVSGQEGEISVRARADGFVVLRKLAIVEPVYGG